MTVNELIGQVYDAKGSQYDMEQLIGWLNTVEGRIYNDIVCTHENSEVPYFDKYYADDLDAELIAPDRFCNVYLYYIEAMIDFHRQEIDRYGNSSQMYNEAFQEYANWYNSTHMPKGKHSFF